MKNSHAKAACNTCIYSAFYNGVALECRRHAPAAPVGEELTQFPIVDTNGFCGDYEPQDEMQVKREPACVECRFFVPDKNSCSTRGECHGIPVATVDEDGNDIRQPRYPRRDNSDVACGLFIGKQNQA